jgi:hypothetical protein
MDARIAELQDEDMAATRIPALSPITSFANSVVFALDPN